MNVWRIHAFVQHAYRCLLVLLYRGRFGRRGKEFHFDPVGSYTYENIFCGDHVSLGEHPRLIASRSKILIGNHVIFGPEVMIYGGNHRFDLVGRFIDTIVDSEKRPEDDRNVVIEDDVWVGTRVTILHGVHVGRGVVIAAGSLVSQNVPPYAVVAGVPARVVRYRWDRETILRHEAILYPSDNREEAEAQTEQSASTARGLAMAGAASPVGRQEDT